MAEEKSVEYWDGWEAGYKEACEDVRGFIREPLVGSRVRLKKLVDEGKFVPMYPEVTGSWEDDEDK